MIAFLRMPLKSWVALATSVRVPWVLMRTAPFVCAGLVMAQDADRGRSGGVADEKPWPADFVDLQDVVPDAVIELRYFTANNFIGKPIDGYEAPRCIITAAAAGALAAVQRDLRPFGLGIKVFDAYRPQRAVNHFVRWAEDLEDQRKKAEYYPRVDKENLFRDGYIAARSGHSRGSTVDMTLAWRDSAADPNSVGDREFQELDMGTPYDFFDIRSHGEAAGHPWDVRVNRLLLKTIMEKHGFRALPQEWWHFTLDNEPFPETYFDFEVR